MYKLKNEIEANFNNFSKEDLTLVKPMHDILEMMLESNPSNEIINQYIMRLQYPIEIIEEKIDNLKKYHHSTHL